MKDHGLVVPNWFEMNVGLSGMVNLLDRVASADMVYQCQKTVPDCSTCY